MQDELSRVVDALPGLVWTALPDGQVDFLNQRWREYTGLSVGEGCGRGWQIAIHPEDLPGLVERWQALLASHKSGEMEARLRRIDGVFRRFVFRVSPLTDESGRVIKWCGINTDIDDRKHAEEELRLSEARKTAILDSALDCIVTIDHEGCITEFNPAAERTFGYRREEVVGRRLGDIIIPPALRERHRQGLARYLATGEAHVLGKRLEMSAIRADGSEFPTELSITRIPVDGPPSFTGYLRDITERKQAEAELRRSEAFLAQGQRLNLTGSFSWIIDTNKITFSEQLYRIFELDPALPVTFEQITSRVHPEDLPLLNEKMNLARTDIADHDYEIRLRIPDGSIKYLRTKSYGIRDREGRLEHIGAIQDVTERRLSEKTLSKIQVELAHMAKVSSLGALTASIAHEVNQPLSGIITNASTCLRMLSASPPNVEGARETARRTIRDGNRASEVITRLRALFSKKEAAVELVDLNEATREVIALTMSELQANRVILRSELDGDLPPVMGDRIQLQQVILNLIRNASDAMSGLEDRLRQLFITTLLDDDDCACLTVRDTGVGIDPQNVDSLFDAFYTTKSAGMGMGLSVSRSIIESHHGRLWAAPNDGPGTTFSFSIPCAPADGSDNGGIGGIQASASMDTQNVTRNP